MYDVRDPIWLMYSRDRVIILNVEPYRDYDLRVHWFGYQSGMGEGMARGALRAKSKQRCHLEPANEVELMVAKGALLDKVAVAHLVIARHWLRSSWLHVACFGGVLGLLSRILQRGQHEPKLFTDLQAFLDALQHLPTTSPLRERVMSLAFSLKLYRYLGFVSSFLQCRQCGVHLGIGGWLGNNAEPLCDTCRQRITNAHKLPERTLIGAQFLIEQPFSAALALTLSTPHIMALEQLTEALSHTTELIRQRATIL